MFCPLWAKGRLPLFRPCQPKDEVWCGGDQTTAHYSVTDDVLTSDGGHCEWWTWKRLQLLTALLTPVWPFSTEIFSNEIQLWSLEIWVDIRVYMLTPWVSDRTGDRRKGSLWSGSKGILWDELEAPPWSLFCRPVTFSRHGENICLRLLQITPDCPKDILRWERSWNKRWCTLL